MLKTNCTKLVKEMKRVLVMFCLWSFSTKVSFGDPIRCLFLEPCKMTWDDRDAASTTRSVSSRHTCQRTKISCAALWDEVESKVKIRGYNVWYKIVSPKIEVRNTFEPNQLPVLVLHGYYALSRSVCQKCDSSLKQGARNPKRLSRTVRFACA